MFGDRFFELYSQALQADTKDQAIMALDGAAELVLDNIGHNGAPDLDTMLRYLGYVSVTLGYLTSLQ